MGILRLSLMVLLLAISQLASAQEPETFLPGQEVSGRLIFSGFVTSNNVLFATFTNTSLEKRHRRLPQISYRFNVAIANKIKAIKGIFCLTPRCGTKMKVVGWNLWENTITLVKIYNDSALRGNNDYHKVFEVCLFVRYCEVAPLDNIMARWL